ncbi:MAG: hypothetical protein SFU85_03695 [Candidatus Methylacidiphilales bacterium]|nr:hypothetical protein [Candidatus Methylacidiphilales bacterium]
MKSSLVTLSALSTLALFTLVPTASAGVNVSINLGGGDYCAPRPIRVRPSCGPVVYGSYGYPWAVPSYAPGYYRPAPVVVYPAPRVYYYAPSYGYISHRRGYDYPYGQRGCR